LIASAECVGFDGGEEGGEGHRGESIAVAEGVEADDGQGFGEGYDGGDAAPLFGGSWWNVDE